VISVLALPACAVAALLFFSSSTTPTRFIGIFGMSSGCLALYRTYRPKS
jgi:Na+/phosphate symporter